MNKVTLTPLLLSIGLMSFAQDPVFSSSDQMQQYLNPAFVGTSRNFRVGLAYRNQWPQLSANYQTYNFQADQYLNEHHSIGILYTYDRAGDLLFTNSFKLNYAYAIKLGTGNLKLGLGVGFLQKYLDVSRVVFGIAVNPQDGFVYTTTIEPIKSNVSGFDVNSGVLYQRERFYAGYSAKHITQPNMSFFENSRSAQPILHSLQVGNRFIINDNNELTVGSNVYYQANSPEMSVFIQNKYKFLIAGAGYWLNSVVFGRVGVAFDSFRILYNYDYVVSGLSNSSTGGAHEIVLQGYFKTIKNTNDKELKY